MITEQSALTAEARYLTAKWRRENAPAPRPKQQDSLTVLLDDIIRFPRRWAQHPENAGVTPQSNMCERCERGRVALAVQLLAVWRGAHDGTPLGVAALCGEQWVADLVELLASQNPLRGFCGHHGGDAYVGYKRPRARPPHIAVVLAAEHNGIAVPPELQNVLDKIAPLFDRTLESAKQPKDYKVTVGIVRKALRELVEDATVYLPDGVKAAAQLTGVKPDRFRGPEFSGPYLEDWGVELAHRQAFALWVVNNEEGAPKRVAEEELLALQGELPLCLGLLSDQTGLELDASRVDHQIEVTEAHRISTEPGTPDLKRTFERTRWDTAKAAKHVLAHIELLRRCRDDLRSEELTAVDEARHLADGSIVAMPYYEWADRDSRRESAFGDGHEDEALVPDQSLAGKIYDKAVYEAEQFSDPLSDRLYVGRGYDDDQHDSFGAGSILHDAEAGLAYGAFDVTIAPFLDPIETDAARSKFSYRTTYEDMDADRGAPGLWYDLPEPSRLNWRDVPRPARRRRKGHSKAERDAITIAWEHAVEQWRKAGPPEFVAFVASTVARLDRRIAELEDWLRDPTGPLSLVPLPFDDWLQARSGYVPQAEVEQIEGDDDLDVQTEDVI